MNRYIRASFAVPFGALKMGWTKLWHPKQFQHRGMCMISPLTEISLDIRGGGQVVIMLYARVHDALNMRMELEGGAA